MGLGISGAMFIASQTEPEILRLYQSTFVYVAESLGVPSIVIFFRHILRNCFAFPLALVKQMRDNILAISFLSFMGTLHLQPEDLAGFIHRIYSNSDIFYQGWWLLFFPCALLSWLILLWNQAGIQFSAALEK